MKIPPQSQRSFSTSCRLSFDYFWTTETDKKKRYHHLCPVRVWASIIKWLLSHPLSSDKIPINTFYLVDNKVHEFTGPKLLKRLCAATTSIAPNILGFRGKQKGLHSAHSGAAMAMYLAGVPVFTITMLGHWSSDAFLRNKWKSSALVEAPRRFKMKKSSPSHLHLMKTQEIFLYIRPLVSGFNRYYITCLTSL
jgi:hypothetical protein